MQIHAALTCALTCAPLFCTSLSLPLHAYRSHKVCWKILLEANASFPCLSAIICGGY